MSGSRVWAVCRGALLDVTLLYSNDVLTGIIIKPHKTAGGCSGYPERGRIRYDGACDTEKVPMQFIKQSTISSGYLDIGGRYL